MLEMLDPTAEGPAQTRELAKALEGLEGTSLAILSNGWPAMEILADELGRILSSKHGATVVHAEIPISNAAAADFLDKTAASQGAALVGLAN
jgi:hypothetical protein